MKNSTNRQGLTASIGASEFKTPSGRDALVPVGTLATEPGTTQGIPATPEVQQPPSAAEAGTRETAWRSVRHGIAQWRLRRECGHDALWPTGWRMAWYEPARGVGVFYPMPLHWVARAAREVEWRVGLLWRAPSREAQEVCDCDRLYREKRRLAEEFSSGYTAGWRECFQACMEAIEEELSTLLPAGHNRKWKA
jgi:hypothetical protein